MPLGVAPQMIFWRQVEVVSEGGGTVASGSMPMYGNGVQVFNFQRIPLYSMGREVGDAIFVIKPAGMVCLLR